jgi:hypothetical protein
MHGGEQPIEEGGRYATLDVPEGRNAQLEADSVLGRVPLHRPTTKGYPPVGQPHPLSTALSSCAAR